MSIQDQGLFDTTMAAVGSKVTYTGATTSVLGWLMSSEFGILVGIILGVSGFIVNWYYKHKQDKREQELHDQRMKENKPYGL